MTGEAHRAAFDIQFAISLKTGFEKLFCVEDISAYDKTNTKAPMLPIASVKIETSSAIEQPTILEPKSNFNPQFFPSLIPSQQHNNNSKALDKITQIVPNNFSYL